MCEEGLEKVDFEVGKAKRWAFDRKERLARSCYSIKYATHHFRVACVRAGA